MHIHIVLRLNRITMGICAEGSDYRQLRSLGEGKDLMSSLTRQLAFFVS